MNIVIAAINSKYIHTCLSAYSLKGYAAKAGKHCNVVEFTINQSREKILADIFRMNPDVLFMPCYIWNIEYVTDIITEFGKINPSVPIWVGGPEISYRAQSFLEDYPQIEGVIIGEGEKPFLELLRFYDRECSLFEIPSIGYMLENGKIVINKAAAPVNMDDIPMLYNNFDEVEHKILYYESSRGCPYYCSYCLSSLDKNLRFKSLDKVYEDIDVFLEHKVPLVKFVDRTFNCDAGRALSIWKYIYEHDNNITSFHFEIAGDLLKEEQFEVLSKMREGLVQFEIGVQTTNFETIREIQRNTSIGRIEDNVLRIKEMNNIHQHLDLIAGLPYEDYDSFKESFSDVYALEPDMLQVGFLKVLNGSKMQQMALEYGLIYTSRPPYEVMQTRWISYAKMLEIKLVADMVDIYYNSKLCPKTLKMLENAFEMPFDMFLHIASCYVRLGYLDRSSAKMEKFKVLYETARQCDVDHFSDYSIVLNEDFNKNENRNIRLSFLDEYTTQRSIS